MLNLCNKTDLLFEPTKKRNVAICIKNQAISFNKIRKSQTQSVTQTFTSTKGTCFAVIPNWWLLCAKIYFLVITMGFRTASQKICWKIAFLIRLLRALLPSPFQVLTHCNKQSEFARCLHPSCFGD